MRLQAFVRAVFWAAAAFALLVLPTTLAVLLTGTPS